MIRALRITVLAALLALLPTSAGAQGWVPGGGHNGSAAPSGPCGGDLGGSYPNCLVQSLSGSAGTVSASATTLSFDAASLITVGGTGPASGTAASLSLSGQNPGATNGTPGGVTVDLAAPTGSGAHAAFHVQEGGVDSFLMYYNGSNTVIDGSTRPLTIQASNYVVLSGTTLYLDGNSTIFRAQGGGAGSNIQIGASGSFGGGTGVLGIANATTAPTSNPSGGGVLWEDSNNGWSHRSSAGFITGLAPIGAGTNNGQRNIRQPTAFQFESTTYAATSTNSYTFTSHHGVGIHSVAIIRVVTPGSGGTCTLWNSTTSPADQTYKCESDSTGYYNGTTFGGPSPVYPVCVNTSGTLSTNPGAPGAVLSVTTAGATATVTWAPFNDSCATPPVLVWDVYNEFYDN